MANQEDIFGLSDSAVDGKTPPSQKVIDWLHGRVSTKKSTDIHHPLGFGPTDASPGDHTHDGKNSKGLFTPEETILNDLTGTATTAQIVAAINAINAALRLKGAGGA